LAAIHPPARSPRPGQKAQKVLVENLVVQIAIKTRALHDEKIGTNYLFLFLIYLDSSDETLKRYYENKFQNSKIPKFFTKLLALDLMVAACNPLGLQDRDQPGPTGPVPALTPASTGKVAENEAKVRQDPRFFEVRQRNGYLEISTPAVFEKLRQDLTNQPQAVLDSWEAKFSGFVSQRSTLEKVRIAEQRHFEAKVAANLGIRDESRSALFAQNAQLFTVTNGHITLKLGLAHMAKFVNAEGIVRIAGHLFQYGPDFIKVVTGGDDRKIPLLASTHQTDKANGIVVLPVEKATRPLGQGRTEQNAFDDDERGFAPTFWYNAGSFYTAISATDYQIPIYDYTQEPYWTCNGDTWYCYPNYPIIGYTDMTCSDTYSSAQARHVLFGWQAVVMNEIRVVVDTNVTSPVSLSSLNTASVNYEIYNSSRIFVSAVSTHTAIRNTYGSFNLTYTTFVSI